MVICDERKLLFMHIPKCGGVTVRRALGDDWSFWGRNRLPDGRTRDFAHLTLADLKQYFPDVWEKLQEFESYALIRHPEERFISSTKEYLKTIQGRDKARLDRQSVLDAARDLRDKIDTADPDYVHFTRQSDFVYCESRRVIDNLYLIEDIDRLASDLRHNHGIEGEFGQRNVAPLTTGGRFRTLWTLLKRLHPGISNWQAIAKAKRILAARQQISLPVDLRRFVLNYYATDWRLYRGLLDVRAAA